MELRQLRYFVAIVDYGGLTRAAAQLGIAQPALSQQLSNLEAECKTQLLVRNSQGVKPTESGKLLYRHARTILRQVEQARDEIQHGKLGESGLVAIGLPTTATLPLALPLLSAVRERYPRLRLQIFESLSGYLAELLANNRLDYAMLFRDAETRSVAVLPLLHEHLFLIGDCGLSDAVKAQDVCTVADLRDVPLVLPSMSHDLRLTLERGLAQNGVEPNIIADVDSLPTMVAAARDGLACTILPSSALLALKGAEQVPPARRIVSPEIVRPLSLCWLEAAPRTPAAAAVHRLIVELVPHLVGEGRWPGVTLRRTGSLKG